MSIELQRDERVSLAESMRRILETSGPQDLGKFIILTENIIFTSRRANCLAWRVGDASMTHGY